jgi:hypothetical protein
MRRFFSEKPADDVPAWLRDATVRTLTQEDLAQQATVLRDQGDLDGALALYRKQESLCRKRPLNVQGLAYSLANQATLLAFGKKQPQEGLPLAMEALRLAKDYHRIEMLDEFQEVIQDIQDAIETDVR